MQRQGECVHCGQLAEQVCADCDKLTCTGCATAMTKFNRETWKLEITKYICKPCLRMYVAVGA